MFNVVKSLLSPVIRSASLPIQVLCSSSHPCCITHGTELNFTLLLLEVRLFFLHLKTDMQNLEQKKVNAFGCQTEDMSGHDFGILKVLCSEASPDFR